MKSLISWFIMCVIAASLCPPAFAGNGGACLHGCSDGSTRLFVIIGIVVIVLGVVAIIIWRRLRSR